jgi:hypothetical protein
MTFRPWPGSSALDRARAMHLAAGSPTPRGSSAALKPPVSTTEGVAHLDDTGRAQPAGRVGDYPPAVTSEGSGDGVSERPASSGRGPRRVDALHQTVFSPDTLAISAAHASAGSGAARGAGDPVPVLSGDELKVLTSTGRGTTPRSTARSLGISRFACRGLTRYLSHELSATSAVETVGRGRDLGLIGAR